MFEDEKDDALTQLFKRSEGNLDKDLPSADLWSRIENRLDHAATAQPLKITKAPTAQPRYWMAAAAALACVLSVGAIWKFFEMSPEQKSLAELQKNSAPLAEDRAKEHSLELPVNEIEKEAKYKSEDSAQAARLSTTTTASEEPTKNDSKPKMLKLSPTVEETPTVVTITQPNFSSNANAMPTPVAPVVADVKKSDAEVDKPRAKTSSNENAGLAAEEPPIPVSNSTTYSAPPISVADDQKIATIEKRQSKEMLNDIAVENNAAKGSIRSRSNAKDKATSVRPSAPSAKDDANFEKINPRLVTFTWLLGQWSETRADGVSHEEWQLKNRNTITGKGYKIKDKDKLFEENMTIFFDENLQQTYLSLNVDDFKKPVVYALNRIEGDQMVFLRDSQGAYPEKVIIQRTKEGYSIIFANEAAELTMTQQSFLNHRNAVSNYKAVRNLRKTTKD
jgi:hypothetical protein